MPNTDAPKKALWKRPKVVLVAIAAVILLILIFQNLDHVQVRLLFYKPTVPLALLLAIVAAIAYVAGVITDGRVFRRSGSKGKGG